MLLSAHERPGTVLDTRYIMENRTRVRLAFEEFRTISKQSKFTVKICGKSYKEKEQNAVKENNQGELLWVSLLGKAFTN